MRHAVAARVTEGGPLTANLLTEWAALLVRSLADAGVRDVVISPGSRSVPFVIAAVREKRMTRHEVIDERAAAFFALGQARVTGRPSVLVCTSGTAAAHYLPAIIEANLMGTPMIVISADRPQELYECRAPQTIDQVKLFGDQARQFFDISPDATESAFRSLRRLGAQAVLTSKWPRAGAVHINARARKPLEPVVAKTPEELQLVAMARRVAAEPIAVAPPPHLAPSPEAVREAAALLRSARRGLCVAGPANLSQRDAREGVWALAAATGFAVAGDSTSQLRLTPKPEGLIFLEAFESLIQSPTFCAKAGFDIAVQIGASPTSSVWEQQAPSLPRIVVAEHGWCDPHSTARALVYGDVRTSCAALAEALRAEPPRVAPEWRAFLKAAEEAASRALERELAAAPFAELSAAHALLDRLRDGSILMVGNSLSVRIIDVCARVTDRDIAVLSQRGASGIDGLVAGAAGSATSSGKPTALLIGDVSLLHDIGSLGLAARVRTPFVILVLHNEGGRIFEQLPLVKVPDIETAVIHHATTPHTTDFAPAAALFGLRYARATCLEDLGRALDQAFDHAGCTVVEARVPASGAMAIRKGNVAAVDAAMASVPAP